MSDIPSEGHAYCRQCTGGDPDYPLWRYSANDYQLDADCLYSSEAECEQINNPRETYIDPKQCLVFFNDDGYDWLLNGVNLFDGVYGATNQQNPIPSVIQGTMTPTEGRAAFTYANTGPLSSFASIEDLTAPESRLWAYDISDNVAYYVDSFPTAGPDISMSHNKLFMGCTYSLQHWQGLMGTGGCFGDFNLDGLFEFSWGWAPENSTCGASLYQPETIAINSYNYTLRDNDLSTWTQSPDKSYRFVDEEGNFITKGYRTGFAALPGTNDGNPSLGMGIATISDTELIIDDVTGNLYYADLTNFWTGDTASTYSSLYLDIGVPIDPSVYLWDTANSVDVQGNPYFDLSVTGYNQAERKPTDGWYHCSNAMGNKVYTIACKTIVSLTVSNLEDAVLNPNYVSGSADPNEAMYLNYAMWPHEFTWPQGDITFNPSDVILSGDPSVTITYRTWDGTPDGGGGVANSSNNYPNTNTVGTLGCPQIPGIPQTPGELCVWKIAKFKFPTDLNNITVQYYRDRFTENAAVQSQKDTPVATHALVKDVQNDKLYGISQKHRFTVDNTTLAFTSPVQIQARLYDQNGIGYLTSWDGGYNAVGVTMSTFGTGGIFNSGQFAHGGDFLGGAQSPSCTDDNYTFNCTINGCVSIYGTGGDYTYYSACTADCISYSCVTSCECPSGATTNNNNFEVKIHAATAGPGDVYEYKEDSNVSAQNIGTNDSCAWKVPYVFVGTSPDQLQFVKEDGLENSQWGSDGTRFCLTNNCGTYVDLTGPATGVASGFWGQTGNYLFNARLNTIGAWPGGVVYGTAGSNTESPWVYQGQTFTNTPWIPVADALNSRKWVGISRCVTVTGTTNQLYLVGIASSDYYRIGVDGVSVINTMQRELSENKIFNPAGFPSYPATAYEQATMTNQNETNSRWWVHRIELTPGDHSITLEGTMNPWVVAPKALGCDIIGPFDVTDYTGATQVALLTPQIYTANTIFSTADLSSEANTIYGGGTNAGTMIAFCQLHDSIGPCPYPVGGQLMYQYPDTYKINWGLGGVTGWVGGGTTTVITLNNGGTVKDFNLGSIQWNINCLPYMAPQNNGVQVFHAGTNVGDIDLDYMPYVTELPTTVGLSTGFPWSGYIQPSNPNSHACESPIPSMVTGGVTYQKPPEGPTLKGITPYIQIGGAAGNPQTWRDFIDYLNAQGLYVSSVPDPGTAIYPNIDYNATFWQVLYAIKDYWTPIFPNGAPNGGHPGGQSEHTLTGNNAPYFDASCYNWCNCIDSPGIFDTQVTQCDNLNNENYYFVAAGIPAGPGINAVTGSLLAGTGNPCGTDCGRDWIYDACYGSCVSTTGCTDQTDSVNFTGGCTPIPGTGYSQTDVFDTLVDCELSCSTSASTGGTIYYLCGDSGCTTASTVTPFTTLAQCTGSCFSYECTNTGCTEFNPPVSTANIGLSPDYYGSGGTHTNQSSCWSTCVSWDCANWGCEQYGLTANLGTGGSYTTEVACTADCRSWECLSNGCVDYIGSGYTFSSATLCTNVCRSFDCTTNCCELYNLPFYGTGGTYYDQASSGASAALCSGDCASWGCNTQVVASGTNIYTFYEITDVLGSGPQIGQDIIDHILGVSAWTQSIYGFTGNSYSILVNDERWLSWGSSVYTGLHTGGTSTTTNSVITGYVHQWAVNAGLDGTIYDNCAAGASFAPLTSNSGNIILAKGPAPVSTAADDVLVITLLAESSRPSSAGSPGTCLYHTPESVWTQSIPPAPLQYHPQYSGGNSSYSCGIPTISHLEDRL